MAEQIPVVTTTQPMDNLIAGEFPIKTRKALVKSGEGELVRGTVLGKIAKELGLPAYDSGNTGDGVITGLAMGAKAKIGNYELECKNIENPTKTVPADGTADGGNTGNGTCTTVSGGAVVKVGTYNLECVDATVSGSEIFQVSDPDGATLAPATVGVAYATEQILFTLNDGSADFIVGDKFTIPVTAADYGVFGVVDPEGVQLPDAKTDVAYVNEQILFTVNDGSVDFVVGDKITLSVDAPSTEHHIKSLAAAVDGSQDYDCILGRDVDATSADVLSFAYDTGEFDESKLVFGAGHTADTIRAKAREKSVFLHTVKAI